MRTRKHVLCVDACEQQLSTRAFLLETRASFRITRARTAAEAVQILSECPSGMFDVLVTELNLAPRGMDGNELVKAARELAPGIRTLITSRYTVPPERASQADLYLPAFATAADLVERVKVLCARKRGPKKPALRVELAEQVWDRIDRVRAQAHVEGTV